MKVLPMTLLVSNRTPRSRRVLHLAVDDLAGQAEARDAVAEHAADHVQRLEHGDVGAVAHQIGGDREPGGAGADHRDLAEAAGERRRPGLREPGVVPHEALEPPDAHRLDLLADDALGLALRLLRADAPADRGEEVGLVDDAEGAVVVAHDQVADEAGDVDLHWATRDASGLRALDAALGLDEGVLEVVAEVHLLEVLGALGGVALGHLGLPGGQLLDLLVVALLLDEELLLQVADVGVVLGGHLLLLLEAPLARDELHEVDPVAVEVRPLDAGELDLAVHGDPARAAHAGAVHHDGVERDHGLDPEGPRGLDRGVHHRAGGRWRSPDPAGRSRGPPSAPR